MRDGFRPPIAADISIVDYPELMQQCWHNNPAVRPTFLEIMNRLKIMTSEDDGNASSRGTSEGQASSVDMSMSFDTNESFDESSTRSMDGEELGLVALDSCVHAPVDDPFS